MGIKLMYVRDWLKRYVEVYVLLILFLIFGIQVFVVNNFLQRV